jgi:hypothetical protein
MHLADNISISNDPATWVALVLVVIPAIASIVSAVLANRSAKEAKRGELEAQRLRELENRISEKKYETYAPMIELIGDFFSQTPSSRDAVANVEANVEKFVKFARWIAIYGSDASIDAYHNLMQSFAHNPPTFIGFRLIADFIFAARKDIGYADTEISKEKLLVVTFRVNDYYEQDELLKKVMTLPLDQACNLLGWPMPWASMNSKPPEQKSIPEVGAPSEGTSTQGSST